MQREVNTEHPLERKLHTDYPTNNHRPQLHAATDLDCFSMTVLSWRKPAVLRIVRKHWNNLKPNHALNFRKKRDFREGTYFPKRKRTENISRERRIRAQLRAAAQRAHRDQWCQRSYGGTSRL